MKRRLKIVIAAVIVAAVLLGGVIAISRVRQQERQYADLGRLKARYSALRDSVEVLASRDPTLEFVRGDSAEIAIAMSEPLVVALIQEATIRYLDQVEIDITDDIDGHGEGKYEVNSPFGKVSVGEWGVVVKVREMVGVISARKPDVQVTGTNRIRLALPARIIRGRGALTLDFSWDSNSLFNAVCRDFKTTQTIRGSVLPQEHLIRGDVLLSVSDRGLVANPDFPPEKFPLSMTLDSASWNLVRGALVEQDKLFRCGLLVNPDSVVQQLRKLGFQGLKFKLPRALFRTFELPASLTQSLTILNSPVALVLIPRQLRISPGLFWYSAQVEAKKSDGPPEPLPLPSRSK